MPLDQKEKVKFLLKKKWFSSNIFNSLWVKLKASKIEIYNYKNAVLLGLFFAPEELKVQFCSDPLKVMFILI